MTLRENKFTVVAWLLLLGIVAFSVFQTARTNDQLARNQACTEQFLGATVLALNERTQYSSEQAQANVELQDAQVRFLTLLTTDRGADPAAFNEAIQTYLDAQMEFSRVASLSAGQAQQYAYPTVEEYRTCLDGGSSPEDIQPPNPPNPPIPSTTPSS